MIVDTHVHVWQIPPIAPVGQTSPKFINLPDEPATVEELITDMDENGVEKAVLVQTSFSTWDNGYVADSATKYPDRLVSMGLLDPSNADNASLVKYWLEERGMSGFRFHPMYYDEESILTAERNVPMWEAIEAGGGVVQVHMYAEHAHQISHVASLYPTIPIILDHLCYPLVSEFPGFESHDAVIELSRYPNVFVKVSDVHGRSVQDYPYKDVHPYIKQVKDAFGIERLMWGTGYPGVHRTKYGWPTLADELMLVMDGYDWLSNSERQRLLGGTASAVWKFA